MRPGPRPAAADSLRVPVFLLFAWIVVEDETRKLFGAPLWVHAVKDLLVAAALALALRDVSARTASAWMPPGLGRVLVWGLLLYGLGSLHPSLDSYLVPLNGIHITFFAVPLFFVGARFAADLRGTRILLWLNLALGAGVAGVGLVQALADPGFLNPLPEDRRADWLVGIVRDDIPYVTGPFLSPGRFVAYLLSGCASALAVYLLSRRTEARLVALAAAAVIAAGLVMSGARAGPVVLGLLVVVAVAIFEGQRRRGLHRSDRSARHRTPALLVSGLVLGAAALATSERLAGTLGFYWETLFAEGGEGLRSRAAANVGFAQFSPSTWLFGNGTGSASFGIQYVFPDFVPVTEGGYSSVAWELGALGLVFYVLLAGRLSALFLRAGRFGHPLAHGLSPAFGALALVELWVLNLAGLVLQQYVVTVPLWFFAGLVANLPPADRAVRS